MLTILKLMFKFLAIQYSFQDIFNKKIPEIWICVCHVQFINVYEEQN